MHIHVNGKKFKLKNGMRIPNLAKELGLNLSKVAIEINKSVIPREEYKKLILKKGDKIEIVTFLGGG